MNINDYYEHMIKDIRHLYIKEIENKTMAGVIFQL